QPGRATVASDLGGQHGRVPPARRRLRGRTDGALRRHDQQAWPPEAPNRVDSAARRPRAEVLGDFFRRRPDLEALFRRDVRAREALTLAEDSTWTAAGTAAGTVIARRFVSAAERTFGRWRCAW